MADFTNLDIELALRGLRERSRRQYAEMSPEEEEPGFPGRAGDWLGAGLGAASTVAGAVSAPVRGLGMGLTALQEKLAGTPLERSRIRLSPGGTAWSDFIGETVQAPTPIDLAIEGIAKTIPHTTAAALTGRKYLDVEAPGAIPGLDERGRKAWERENIGLARAEAVAEPLAHLGLMLAAPMVAGKGGAVGKAATILEPTLASLGALSRIARTGKLAPKLLAAGKITAEQAAALARRGRQAEIAGRTVAGSFSPGMAVGAVEGGREFMRAGEEEGYASPAALRAGMGTLESGVFAGLTGAHALGLGPHAKAKRETRPALPKNAWEVADQRNAEATARKAAEVAPVQGPERVAPEVWEGERPGGRAPELEQEALRLDEEIYGGEPPLREEFVPVDRAAEADFLRPDVEARVAGEQARLGRRYREQTPESVAEGLIRAPEDLELEALRMELEAELGAIDAQLAEGLPRERQAASERARETQALEAEAAAREAQDAGVGGPVEVWREGLEPRPAIVEPPPEIGARPRAEELETLRRELEGELPVPEPRDTLESAIAGALGQEPGAPRMGRRAPPVAPGGAEVPLPEPVRPPPPPPERRVAERPEAPARRLSPEERAEFERRLAAGEVGREELEAQFRRARQEADLDPLTGLLGKGEWEARLETVKPEDSVVVVDLKKFKPINDKYGHPEGDKVLKAAGEAIRKIFGDESSRFGGDEFGALARGMSVEAARARGEVLRDELSRKIVRLVDPKTGKSVDIEGIPAHIGVGRDAKTADTAANDAAAPSRQGGRGDVEIPVARPDQDRPVPGVGEAPEGGVGDRVGAGPAPRKLGSFKEFVRSLGHSWPLRTDTPERLGLAKRLRGAFEGAFEGAKAAPEGEPAPPPAKPEPTVVGAKPKPQALREREVLPEPELDAQGNRILPGQEDWSPEERGVVHGAADAYVKAAVQDETAEPTGRHVIKEEGRGGTGPAVFVKKVGVRSAKRGTPLQEVPGSPKEMQRALKRDKGNELEKEIHKAIRSDPQVEAAVEVAEAETTPARPTGLVQKTAAGEQRLIPGALGVQERPTRTEGREGEGPLFTQAEEARIRAEERSQMTLGEEPSAPRGTVPEGQQRYPVKAVTPEEYARAERDPEHFPREETVGHIEAATEAEALAAFQKRRGEFPEGAELAGRTMFAVAEKAPPFFSHLRQVVDKIKQRAGNARDFLQYLTSPKHGVKAEELRWTGLEQFLKNRKGKVTKQELQDFLDANDVEMEEVVRGEGRDNLRIQELAEERTALGRPENFTPEQRARAREIDEKRNAMLDAPAKFGQWQLPGGKEGSYREVLFRLKPKVTRQPEVEKLEQELRGLEADLAELRQSRNAFVNQGGEPARFPEKREYSQKFSRAADLRQRIIAEDKATEQAQFKGGHWEEPNVLAHVRFNERSGPNGERVLFVEEVQSDWHQAGKKRGYRKPVAPVPAREYKPEDVRVEARENDYILSTEDGRGVPVGKGTVPDEAAARKYGAKFFTDQARKEAQDAAIRLADEGAPVPPAPFAGATKSPWHEMVMRRMVRWAAEEGYDKISWISGEETAKRYDLSKQLSRIRLEDNTSGGIALARMEGPFTGGMFRAFDLDGKEVIERYVRSEAEIGELIGKEPTQKLFAAKAAQERSAGMGVRAREVSGLDLKIGGEWAKNLYDVMIPSAMKKFGKQWGAEVGETEITSPLSRSLPEPHTPRKIEGEWAVVRLRDGEVVQRGFASLQEARASAGKLSVSRSLAFQSMSITPEMRRSVVEKGVPRFAAQPAEARAKRAAGLKELKRGLPGAKFKSHAKGVIATLPDGTRLLLKPDATIVVDPTQFEAAYRRAFRPDKEFVAGSWEETKSTAIPYDGVVQLSGNAPPGTGFHELWHAAKALALDEKQRADVAKMYPKGEETESNAYAEWMLKPTKHGPFQAIRRFFQRMYRALRPTVESRAERVFEEVRGGKVWKGRGVEGARGPPRFAVAPLEPAPRGTYRAAEEGLGDRLIRYFQDKYVRLKRTVESVRGRGGRVTEETDPYLAVERFDSITAEKLRDTERKLADPLVAALGKPLVIPQWRETRTGRVSTEAREVKASLEDLGDYMSLRHIPTRDPLILKRTKGELEHGSGWQPEEVDATWAALEKKFGDRVNGRVEALEPMAKIVRAARKETLRVMVDGGLLSEAQAKGWVETFGEDYVPMRTAEVEAGPGTGQGFDIRGRESKSATGRTTKADNPVVFMMSQLQRAIVRAEKNKVDQTFAKFVEENPEPALWEQDVKHMRKEVGPDGTVQEVRDQLADREDLAYKVDGKAHRITIRDPLLQRAMKNLSAQETGELLRKLGGFTRFYSQMVTSWNPEFIVSNFARDIQQAVANVGVEQGAKIAKQIPKNVLPAMKGMWDVLRKPGGTGKWATYAKELREDGGTIGFYFLKDIPALERQMGARIRAAGPGAARAAQRALTGIRDLVEDVNKSVENGTRLAVYAALREAGASRIKAASVAKNVTLNFNRKGEAGAGINSLYVFFNASMQGTKRLAEVLRTKRGQKLAAGIIAGGWAIDQYNRAAGGDSDKDGTNDWDAIPPWIKERNLILMRGEGKRPVMFPMPYGFNVLHNLGQLVGATTAGDMTAARAAGSMASSLWNSFNPLGSEADLAQVLSPTALDPIIQHEMNKDFTGRAIRPTRYPGQARPDSELYFRNVPPLARGLAGALNRATGGDKVTPGMISVSPETLDHFWKFFTGGLGRFGSNAANTLTSIAMGEAPSLRSVPFARRLVYEEHPGATGMRFREGTEELDTIWARYKHYRETGDREAAAKLPRAMLRAKKYVDSIEKRIRAIRRAGRAVPNADERIEALQRQANRAIAEARRKAA